jgi:NTP pyrophosphatase (non-canonical NTP hydrolase)
MNKFKMYEQEQVARLMQAYDHKYSRRLTIPPTAQVSLMLGMFVEEVQELQDALTGITATGKHPLPDCLIDTADAIGDCLITLLNIANIYGVCVRSVFDEIIKSNKTKLGVDGKVIKNAEGKVQKPRTYIPPNLKDVLTKQNT